ncbi:MAG: hypothetical protein U9R25_20200 [Chloroflexota bacterium]|nr:hypothetical protein [Chloroflexota bacterium]
MQSSLDLSIANIEFRITTPSPEWTQHLRSHYGDFLADDQATWTIDVVQDSNVNPLSESWVVHEESVTRFWIGIYGGTINLANQVARVGVATPQQAPFAVDRVLAFVCMQVLAREGRGLLLHGAGIERHGQGLAFCGPSGAGKTTVSRLATDPHAVLTDETPIVLLTESLAMLRSTPFWGASTPDELISRSNRQVPLRALLFLEQWPAFELTPLQPSEAVMALLATEKVATERVSSAMAWLTVAGKLVSQVPSFRLRFRPDQELWGFLDRELFER